MSINLLELAKDQITGALAKNASSFLGESEENTAKALGGIFPSLLGTLVSKGADETGAEGLLKMINGVDPNMISHIGDIFGGGSSSINNVMNSGSGILSSLLGNKMGSVVDVIASMSGMKGGSTSSLIKMAAPMLMSLIGKQVAGKGVSGLMSLLAGQKGFLKGAIPSALASSLGLGGLLDSITGAAGKATDAVTDVAGKATDAVTDVAGKATDAVSGAAHKTVDAVGDVAGKTADLAKDAVGTAGNVARKTANVAGDVAGKTVDTAASAGRSIWRIAVPIVLGLFALGVGMKMCGGSTGIDALDSAAEKTVSVTENVAKGTADVAKDAAGAVGDVAKGAASLTGDALKSAFSTVDATAKAALDKVKFAAGSAGSQMMKFIAGGFKGDNKFKFENLTFASGSATIEGSSGVEVDNIAAVLKAYPKINIVVEGYTDNQGNPHGNARLSESRAQSVKTRLVSQGVDASRIAIQGYGQANPVASNDTPEGRRQNRRIEVRIVQ